VFDVELFVAEDGSTPFARWFDELDSRAADRVDTSLQRMRRGNFGDHKAVGEGVIERRIRFGPGYRLYYGRDGKRLVVVLAGGSKKTQSRDIRTAQRLWKRYKEQRRREPWPR